MLRRITRGALPTGLNEREPFTGRGTGSLFGPLGFFSARWAFPSASGRGANHVPLRLGRRRPSHVRGEKGVSKNPQPSPPRKSGTVRC